MLGQLNCLCCKSSAAPPFLSMARPCKLVFTVKSDIRHKWETHAVVLDCNSGMPGCDPRTFALALFIWRLSVSSVVQDQTLITKTVSSAWHLGRYATILLRKEPRLLFDFKFSWTVRLALDVKLSKWFIHHLFIPMFTARIWVFGAWTADSLSFQEFSNHLHLVLSLGSRAGVVVVCPSSAAPCCVFVLWMPLPLQGWDGRPGKKTDGASCTGQIKTPEKQIWGKDC